jgi:hypothetical protein
VIGAPAGSEERMRITESAQKVLRETKFCSRICAGKYRKSKNQMTDDMRKKISDSLIGKKYEAYKRKYKQVWVTDGIVTTRIKEGDKIPEGFKRGRVVSN